MAIDSKDLLVQLKAFSRAGSLPLDSSEVQDSLEAAQNYAKSAKAYAGQTIKALVDGKYVSYVLQPSGSGTSLELSKVGVDASEVKTVVRVVDSLPESGQEQGVLYINLTDHKGYVYNGSAFVQVFEQVEALGDKVAEAASKIQAVEGDIATIKGSAETEGSIANAISQSKSYTDTVKGELDSAIAAKADANAVYTKVDADAAIQKAITDSGHLKRSIVSSLPAESDADPNTIYMVPKGTADGAQQHYDEFMLLNGAFEKIGDTKVDLADYATKEEVKAAKTEAVSTAATDASTKADAARDAAIVTAATDAQTKADKALEDAKADTTAKVAESLQSAKGYADSLASNYEVAGAANKALESAKGYADGVKTAAEKVAKDYTDTQVATINGNLNTKVTADDVAAAIKNANGELPEGQTVKDYIDKAVGAGGADVSSAIATAKTEAIEAAKSYTDTALTIVEF